MTHFADRLAAAVRAKGNALCVGLDPRWESLPLELRRRHGCETPAGVAAAVAEAAARPVNPSPGRDAVERSLQSARRAGAGVFVLVRTSNPGAGLFQDLDCGGKPLYQHVGEAAAAWARESLGECGLGDVGAV